VSSAGYASFSQRKPSRRGFSSVSSGIWTALIIEETMSTE
jgi:hypothetical protein